MKFNVFFTIRGVARTLECENTSNPVECDNLASLLSLLSTNLPSFGVETVGIRVVNLPEATKPETLNS